MRTVPLASALVCLLVTSTAALAQAPEAPGTLASEPPPSSTGGIIFEPLPPPKDVVEKPLPKQDSGLHLDLGAATDYPISMGGLATMEVPGRLLFSLGLGFMPQPYASSIDALLVAVHAYDNSVSQLVREALSSSFVLRASGGWRPLRDHGLELYGGYTLITLGGSANPVDVVNTVLAESGSPDRISGSYPNASVALTLHNVHATIGWRWLLANDHLVVRAALSYMQCLAASANVSLPTVSGASPQMTEGVSQALGAFIAPYLTTYGKAPVASLSASYRF